MADGKIYITISDKRSGGTVGVPQETPTQADKEQESTLSKYSQHEFFNFVKSQATKAVNYSLGNIGNFTGDYETQRGINAGLQAGNKLLSYGFALTSAGPIGLAIAVGSDVVNYALSENTLSIQQRATNRNIAELRQLSGLDSTTNGSRW